MFRGQEGEISQIFNGSALLHETEDGTQTMFSPRVTVLCSAHPDTHRNCIKLRGMINSDTASHRKRKTHSSSQSTAAK